MNGYTITWNLFWQKWQVGHINIAPVVAEFDTEAEAIQYAERG